MLQALIGQSYKDGTLLTDKQIAHIMIALLMAGQHTSAATGSWLLLHIGQNQRLQQALYDEQVKHWGNPDGTLRPLEYENLQSPLLNACIKEVLRMHAPIHSIMRYVRESMAVPPGLGAPSDGTTFVIPKGQYLLASPGFSQMDPAHWEEPQKFNPERWLTTSGESKQESTDDDPKEDFGYGVISTGANSPYLPFGAGRHRCIGEQFAFLQLATIFATLIREATWSTTAEVPNADYSTMIVMPATPRNIHIKRRL